MTETRKYKICIDPGHGDAGGDMGAVGKDKTTESSITLSIGKMLKGEIVKNGYDVVMTREQEKNSLPIYSDALGDLPFRTKLSNDNDCDLFISLHCNSAASSNAKGFEVFYCNGSTNGNKMVKLLYMEIFKNVVLKGNLVARGIKVGDFYVLKKTDCPAILIEFAFISNSSDLIILKSYYYQTLFVAAIVNAVKQYFK